MASQNYSEFDEMCENTIIIENRLSNITNFCDKNSVLSDQNEPGKKLTPGDMDDERCETPYTCTRADVMESQDQQHKENLPMEEEASAQGTKESYHNPLLNFTQLMREDCSGEMSRGTAQPNAQGHARGDGAKRKNRSSEESVELSRRDESMLGQNISCISLDPVEDLTAEDKLEQPSDNEVFLPQSSPSLHTEAQRNLKEAGDKMFSAAQDTEPISSPVHRPNYFTIDGEDDVFLKYNERSGIEESVSQTAQTPVEIEPIPQMSPRYHGTEPRWYEPREHLDTPDKDAEAGGSLDLNPPSVPGSLPPSVGPSDMSNPPSVSETTMSVPSVSHQLDQTIEYQESLTPDNGDGSSHHTLRDASLSNKPDGDLYHRVDQDYPSSVTDHSLRNFSFCGQPTAQTKTTQYSYGTYSTSVSAANAAEMSRTSADLSDHHPYYNNQGGQYQNYQTYGGYTAPSTAPYTLSYTDDQSAKYAGSYNNTNYSATYDYPTTAQAAAYKGGTGTDQCAARYAEGHGGMSGDLIGSSGATLVPYSRAEGSQSTVVTSSAGRAAPQSSISVLSGWNARGRVAKPSNTEPVPQNVQVQAPHSVIAYGDSYSFAPTNNNYNQGIYQSQSYPSLSRNSASQASASWAGQDAGVQDYIPPSNASSSTVPIYHAASSGSVGAAGGAGPESGKSKSVLLRHYLTSESPMKYGPDAVGKGLAGYQATMSGGGVAAHVSTSRLVDRKNRLTRAIQTSLVEDGSSDLLRALYYFYSGRASEIEARRKQTLNRTPALPPILDTINAHFDQEHACVLEYVESQLDAIIRERRINETFGYFPQGGARSGREISNFAASVATGVTQYSSARNPAPMPQSSAPAVSAAYSFQQTSGEERQFRPGFYREVSSSSSDASYPSAASSLQSTPVPPAPTSTSVPTVVGEKASTPTPSSKPTTGKSYVNKTPEKTLKKLKRFLPEGIKPLCADEDNGVSKETSRNFSQTGQFAATIPSVVAAQPPLVYPYQTPAASGTRQQYGLRMPAPTPGVRTPLLIGSAPASGPRLGQLPVLQRGISVRTTTAGYGPQPTHPGYIRQAKIGQPPLATPLPGCYYTGGQTQMSVAPNKMGMNQSAVPAYSNSANACSNLSAYVCDYPGGVSGGARPFPAPTEGNHSNPSNSSIRTNMKPNNSPDAPALGVTVDLQQRRGSSCSSQGGGDKEGTTPRSKRSRKRKPSQDSDSGGKKHATLNTQAVKIMQRWYDLNVSHPYPSVETAELIADRGHIAVEQVKKWFANKRLRNKNTKSLSAIAALRRSAKDKDPVPKVVPTDQGPPTTDQPLPHT